MVSQNHKPPMSQKTDERCSPHRPTVDALNAGQQFGLAGGQTPQPRGGLSGGCRTASIAPWRVNLSDYAFLPASVAGDPQEPNGNAKGSAQFG